MCEPVSIVMAAVAIIGSVAQNQAAKKSAKRQTAALEEQNQIVADEISSQQGQELDQRARAARQERAAARASASEAGINLGSNSFLAMLQTSEINQSIDSGLILRNEKGKQRGRQAQHKSNLAGIQWKTGLGMTIDAAASGASAYSASGGKMYLGRQPGRG